MLAAPCANIKRIFTVKVNVKEIASPFAKSAIRDACDVSPQYRPPAFSWAMNVE